MAEDKFLTIEKDAFPYIFIKNKDIPLKSHDKGVLRCNVYLPKDAAPFGQRQYPVIATYGPYGKDVPYGIFFPKSWDQLNSAMKSEHASWETPDPGYWTSQNYIVVRVDERGSGQSPGLLDTMSRGTSEAFFDVVEWCAEQKWSSGKVGLLGISYFAGTQWRVAARRPKGLAAIIPWEGMSDYYRDRVRHGGILSDKFIKFWWDNAVQSNQYGKAGRASRRWGDYTLEGDLDEDTLSKNRRNQTVDTADHKYLDDQYYQSRTFDLTQIEVPLLSVANWGGILLHLRGNVMGWMQAASPHKFLRFIVGRHDLPFYYSHSAEMQLSFFDSFLKGNDYGGWKTGEQPRVQMCLRKGDAGVDDPQSELAFPKRNETDWPIPDTRYTKLFLAADNKLSESIPGDVNAYSYDAVNGEPLQFSYKATSELEITGHSILHLDISAERLSAASIAPADIDIFVTLRKLNQNCQEIFFTGTMGDPVPIVKGWQRVSLRKIDQSHPLNSETIIYRNYLSTDAEPVEEKCVYSVDVEIWPTSVVLEQGETLILEIAGHDTQGCGNFYHDHPDDRNRDIFAGSNVVHVRNGSSWLTIPIIPDRSS